MNARIHINGLLALGLAGAFTATGAPAAVLMAESEPQQVFSGVGRSVSVKLQSAGTQPVVDLRWRLLQTTTATTTTIAGEAWKPMQLAPGQTILERLNLDFPAVRAETRFLLQWIAGGSNLIGQTEVLVYPTNLLVQLKALAGAEPLGVFDPADKLKTLLRIQAVEFVDLGETGSDKFQGKLAIVGPFETKAQMRASLRDDIRALAKRGVAVVWLQPPPTGRVTLKPSFYIVREHPGAVVVAAHELTAGLAEHPQAQLNLLRLAEAALLPPPLVLPETETSK